MRYTIKKLNTYPKNREICWECGVYLGVSMNNMMFKDKKAIEEMSDLIIGNAGSFHILIGDYLHRFNQQIYDGLTEEAAITEALIKGASLIAFLKDILPHAQQNFIYTGDFLKKEGFREKIERFGKVYNNNSEFSSCIDLTIDIFLRRQENIKVPMPKARKLCFEYLIEELAIFECLAEDGFLVNIYPGNQLPVIKDIINGKLKDVSPILENIQAIEIKFKPVL